MVQQSKHQTQIRVLLSKYSTSFFCHLNLINFLFVFLCLPIQKLLHPLKKRSSSSVTLAINSSSIMSMICSSLVQLSNSFPRDCVPKSCGINRQFCVFDDVNSGVFEVITESGIMDMKQWRSLEARLRSLLERGSKERLFRYRDVTCIQYFLRAIS